MNVYHYIADTNPNQANDLLRNYGFNRTNDLTMISKRLKHIVRENKVSALRDIADIHPDKKLFLSFHSEKKEEYLNITGRTPEISSENLDEKAKELVQDVKKEMSAFRADIEKEFNKRSSGKTGKSINKAVGNVNNNIGQVSQKEVLMMAVAFAIGYMLANK